MYTYDQLKERFKIIASMTGGALVFSNQYGMLMLLTQNNEIVLNGTDLLSYPEQQKAKADG